MSLKYLVHFLFMVFVKAEALTRVTKYVSLLFDP